MRKIRETDKKITLQKAVHMVAWTHNTNTNILGYDPMSLVTGKSVTFPGISTGNIATESMFDSEAVKKVMERHHEVMKEFREIEYLRTSQFTAFRAVSAFWGNLQRFQRLQGGLD